MSKSSNMIITRHMTQGEIRPGIIPIRRVDPEAILARKQVAP